MGVSRPLGRMILAVASESPFCALRRQMMNSIFFERKKEKEGGGDFTQPSASGALTVRDEHQLAFANMLVKPSAGMSMGCAGFRSTIAGTKTIVRAPVPHRTRDQRAGHPPEE